MFSMKEEKEEEAKNLLNVWSLCVRQFRYDYKSVKKKGKEINRI